MARAEELIDRLKDFRTRSGAKEALIEMGAEAAGPLVAALGSRHASVRWAAAAILGELGAREAVPNLVEALRDDEMHSAAVEALERITGEELGEGYDAWKRWLDAGGSLVQALSTGADTSADADLVRDAVYNTDVSASEQAPGYVLTVPFGDRHQSVFVNFKAKDSDGVPLVVIYTRCGQVDAKHYEWALRQNIKMAAGAIAIADIEGKPNFVVVDVLVRSTATPRLLLDSVRRVALKGDQLEIALTKADKF